MSITTKLRRRVLQELLGEHRDGRRRFGKFGVETTAGERVAGLIAHVRTGIDGEWAQYNRRVRCIRCLNTGRGSLLGIGHAGEQAGKKSRGEEPGASTMTRSVGWGLHGRFREGRSKERPSARGGREGYHSKSGGRFRQRVSIRGYRLLIERKRVLPLAVRELRFQ